MDEGLNTSFAVFSWIIFEVLYDSLLVISEYKIYADIMSLTRGRCCLAQYIYFPHQGHVLVWHTRNVIVLF